MVKCTFPWGPCVHEMQPGKSTWGSSAHTVLARKISKAFATAPGALPGWQLTHPFQLKLLLAPFDSWQALWLRQSAAGRFRFRHHFLKPELLTTPVAFSTWKLFPDSHPLFKKNFSETQSSPPSAHSPDARNTEDHIQSTPLMGLAEAQMKARHAYVG